MYKRYIHDIRIAFDAIMHNKLRSVLTALGIIFGVAAVISMMAIGKGARKEILEQIKMVGVNNIVISPIVEDDNNSSDSEEQSVNKEEKKFSPGLNLADKEAIQQVLPNLKAISAEVSMNTPLIVKGKRKNSKITGIDSEYFGLFNLELSEGNYFSAEQEENAFAVCVIGANLKTQFFNNEDPVGKIIKAGNTWLKIIGVLKKTTTIASESGQKGAITINDGVFIPVKTFLMRFQNRSLVNTQTLNQNKKGKKISHQLDKIIVQVSEAEQLTPTADVLVRMLARRHNEVPDVNIVVPELLLKQQEKTKSIFNIVLGVIAGISLLVGGIGIMNIMFASVMERIREIGVRLSIGAKKADIVVQFLSEAVMISFSGGIFGVILGIIGSYLISAIAGIETIVSFVSVLISFFVSVTIGIIFGYYPAKKASEKDPVESLRYE